jgi:hypothetical protein
MSHTRRLLADARPRRAPPAPGARATRSPRATAAAGTSDRRRRPWSARSPPRARRRARTRCALRRSAPRQPRPEPAHALRATIRRAVQLRHGRARLAGREQSARQMRDADRDDREPLPESKAAPFLRPERSGTARTIRCSRTRARTARGARDVAQHEAEPVSMIRMPEDERAMCGDVACPTPSLGRRCTFRRVTLGSPSHRPRERHRRQLLRRASGGGCGAAARSTNPALRETQYTCHPDPCIPRHSHTRRAPLRGGGLGHAHNRSPSANTSPASRTSSARSCAERATWQALPRRSPGWCARPSPGRNRVPQSNSNVSSGDLFHGFVRRTSLARGRAKPAIIGASGAPSSRRSVSPSLRGGAGSSPPTRRNPLRALNVGWPRRRACSPARSRSRQRRSPHHTSRTGTDVRSTSVSIGAPTTSAVASTTVTSSSVPRHGRVSSPIEFHRCERRSHTT